MTKKSEAKKIEKTASASRRPGIKPIPSEKSLIVFDDPAAASTRRDFVGRGGKITALAILRYIAKNQGVNTPKLAKFFVKTQKTISRWTTELRYRKLVEFRGAPSLGGYFLTSAGLELLENPDAESAFVSKRMSETIVLDFIEKHPGVNHFDIAAHFHRTVKAASRHTHDLRMRGEIVFRGTPREGGFFCVKKSK